MTCSEGFMELSIQMSAVCPQTIKHMDASLVAVSEAVDLADWELLELACPYFKEV